jgi:hypothetical protein
MNFFEAFSKMKVGEKIARSIWSEDEYIYTDNSNKAMYKVEDGVEQEMLFILVSDFMAEDWDIVI